MLTMLTHFTASDYIRVRRSGDCKASSAGRFAAVHFAAILPTQPSRHLDLS